MREVREAFRRGDPPDHPDVLRLAHQSRELRLLITGGDPQLTAGLRRYNDAGFARSRPEGGFTGPALISYLEQAGRSS